MTDESVADAAVTLQHVLGVDALPPEVGINVPSFQVANTLGFGTFSVGMDVSFNQATQSAVLTGGDEHHIFRLCYLHTVLTGMFLIRFEGP